MAERNVLKRIRSGLFSWRTSSSWGELLLWILVIFAVRTFGFGLYQVPTGSAETTMLIGESFFADKLTYWFRAPKRGEIISLNDVTFKYSPNPIKKLFQRYVWGPTNVTKRLIAVPGDTIKGVIEDGKTVVYLNGEKLKEPYLNKYPLIGVYGEDPKLLAKRYEKENLKYVISGQVSMAELQDFAAEQASYSTRWKTYDPAKPFNHQPFYNIDENFIRKNKEGEIELRWPGTPLEKSKYNKECHVGKNHWNGTDEFYVELGPNQYWGMGDNREGSCDCRFFGPIDGSLIHGKMLFRIFSVDSSQTWMIFDLLRNPIDFFKRVRWSRCLQLVK